MVDEDANGRKRHADPLCKLPKSVEREVKVTTEESGRNGAIHQPNTHTASENL
jgi:hypothetical protein